MPNNPPTPAEIVELRRRLGLSQVAFARLLNERVPGLRTTQQAVARWEAGTFRPSGVAAHALLALMAEEPVIPNNAPGSQLPT